MNKIIRNVLIAVGVIACFVLIYLIFEFKINSSAVSTTCVDLNGGRTCHTEDPNPYRNYGTKTAYHVAAQEANDTVDVGDCTPKVFYLLSRHATRYPDKEYIDYINNHLPMLREKILNSSAHGKVNMCDEDLDEIWKWRPTMTSKDNNKISVTGATESMELGKRLRKRFPKILGLRYSSDVYSIAYTSKKRTEVTAVNFGKGLFTEQEYERINFKDKENDHLLKFNTECKKIKANCENQDELYDTREVEKFKTGMLMNKVVTSVSKRIGFNVTQEDVKHMYTACIFGYALNISEAWCSVFSKDDLKVLEYNADIDDYYKDGYGNELNAKQACPVVKYIIDLFKLYQSTKRSKVALHFSHSGVLKKVYAAFGLFKDDQPLKADNFCGLNNRKWRVSDISPFNTNIVFVLYECYNEYWVMTLHNEKPVVIDGCEGLMCPLKNFYDKYSPVGEDCNLNEICNICSKY